MYLIDRETGEVFSIKAYGVPNRLVDTLAGLTARYEAELSIQRNSPVAHGSRRGGVMTGRHTPGPWYLSGGPRQPQIVSEADPSGRTLAIVYDGKEDGEVMANARLLAAAPELLAALEATLDHACSCDHLDGPCRINGDTRRAVAQARGETP